MTRRPRGAYNGLSGGFCAGRPRTQARFGSMTMACAIRIALGLLGGAAGGYVLSRLLCIGGGCPITSNRPLMILVGAGFGVLLAAGGCSGVAGRQKAHAGKLLTSAEQFRAEVIDPGKPAVVDFYSDNCGACRQLAPVLAALEKEYAGKIAFFRVDTARAGALADEHSIRYIPTLEFYRDGKPHGQRTTGYMGPDDLRKRLDGLLKGD